jgi:hypothetical protein
MGCLGFQEVKKEKPCNCSTIKNHSFSGRFYAKKTRKPSEKYLDNSPHSLSAAACGLQNTVFQAVFKDLSRKTCLSSYEKITCARSFFASKPLQKHRLPLFGAAVSFFISGN